jgi:hypothetical protein
MATDTDKGQIQAGASVPSTVLSYIGAQIGAWTPYSS